MKMEEIIIDATNATLGRMASYAAKQVLLGKKVIILNSEKSIITGRKKFIIEKYKARRKRGGTAMHGPLISKLPERIVKRTIRGMLNYKEGRGREAFKRILCYKGVPGKYKDKKMLKAGKEKRCVYTDLAEVSRKL